MRVLGAVEYADGRTIRDRIRAVSEMTFNDEQGIPRQFTWRTIETWRCRYRLHGVTAMEVKSRSDKGKTRKISLEAVQEAVDQAMATFHTRPKKRCLYRECLAQGLLRRDQIAPNTFSRIVDQYEMLKPDSEVDNKHRLAFSKQYANQMWQADTMYGPHVKHHGVSRPTYLIAFIDDASRVVCHGEFYLNENTESMTRALRSALYKRGLPEQIYVDNGSIYTSAEMIAICARIGCMLCHTPVRDAAAKGKVERFFRTVREDFLTRQLDLSSLELLNRQFTTWAEDEYNARTHSTLGMKPIDRFGVDLPRIRFLPPCEANDELFFVEEDRHVKNDNTFSFKSTRYEAPRDLRRRKIQIRFARHNLQRVVVYYKSQRMGDATPIDYHANDRKPAKRGIDQ
jgi:transposase InsO family protein